MNKKLNKNQIPKANCKKCIYANLLDGHGNVHCKNLLRYLGETSGYASCPKYCDWYKERK